MDPEDLPISEKDCTDTELYILSNLQRISASKHLLGLLKEYLDEPDEKKRQLLAASMMLHSDDKENLPHDSHTA